MTARFAAPPDHFSLPATELAALRRRYRRRHWLRLEGFLNPATLRLIERQLPSASFRLIRGISSRRETSAPMSRVLTVLFSHPALLAFVRGVTGEKVQALSGVVYRQSADPRQYILWHQDDDQLQDGRTAKVTMLVNLGGAYRGGQLELRLPGPRRRVARVANTGRGDAILFRNDLTHRAAPIVGCRPKTQFIGWFSPDRLHEAAAKAGARRALERGRNLRRIQG